MPGPVQTGPLLVTIGAGQRPNRGSDDCPDWCSKSGAPVGSGIVAGPVSPAISAVRLFLCLLVIRFFFC